MQQEECRTINDRTIRHLHRSLPIESKPFLTLARELGTTEDEVLEVIRALIAHDVIRRYGAVVRHGRIGYSSNVLVAWNMPEERIDEFDKIVREIDEVSHVYERTRYPEWNYNIYTMIHGHSRDECLGVVERISNSVKIKEYVSLFTRREFKKRKLDLDSL